MPTVITDLQLARLAYGEAARLSPGLPADLIDDAVFYVEEAREALRSASGYDPKKVQFVLARRAIIEYVKAVLLGQTPQNTAGYTAALHEWSRAAAIEVSSVVWDEIAHEESRFKTNPKTIRRDLFEE